MDENCHFWALQIQHTLGEKISPKGLWQSLQFQIILTNGVKTQLPKYFKPFLNNNKKVPGIGRHKRRHRILESNASPALILNQLRKLFITQHLLGPLHLKEILHTHTHSLWWIVPWRTFFFWISLGISTHNHRRYYLIRLKLSLSKMTR